jgi:hypothetical protein
MNHLVYELKPTHKINSLSFVLWLLPIFLSAQSRIHFPVVDLTTNAVSWTEKMGSLGAQVSPLSWLGIHAGLGYGPQQTQIDQFTVNSASFELQGEARLFPFGPPHHAFKKDTRPAFWKKPKIGCSGKSCAWNSPKSSGSKILSGLYFAPGYSFHRHRDAFIPKGEQVSQNPGYQYNIVTQGPMLSAGYQIRLRNFTLGAGYGLKTGQPKVSGTMDIPPKQETNGVVYSADFPMKVTLQRQWTLEVGINF